MKLMIVATLLFSLNILAASKVVEKTRILEEKIVSADGCLITGDYVTDNYAISYIYTVTMKTSVIQKLEAYSVKISKSRNGKMTETEIENSTKPTSEKTVASTQSITYPVRYPAEEAKQALLKACEDEMTFLNTGSYPPPPPRPVIIEEPKKDPVVKPTPPNDPTLPPIGGLPGQPPIEIPADEGPIVLPPGEPIKID